MNVSNTISAMVFAPLNSTVYSVTRYNINVTHAVPHTINDYVIIDIDSAMTYSVSLSCASLSGIASISCVIVNTTQAKITYSSLASASIQYYILNLTNYQISNTNVVFSMKIYDSINYLMETGTTNFQFTSALISTISVSNNDKIALYERSQITLTLTTPFALLSSFVASSTSILVTIPAGFTISGNSTCLASIGVCSPLSATQYLISGVGLTINNFIITLK